MRFWLLKATVIVLGLLGFGCRPAQGLSPKAPGRYVEQVKSGTLSRGYILHVPSSYDGSHPIPVVVVLHGWSASAALAEIYTRMADEGESKGFATVFLDGLGDKGMQGWNAGFVNFSGSQGVDDVKYVSDVLDQMERELNVDRDREYVCGHSNGAFLANDIGSLMGGRLAAIGSVAGTVGLGDKTVPDPKTPISVILIHGTADSMVAYGPNSHALLKGFGAERSARWWASKDGCSSNPTVSRDGNAVTELFRNGRDGAEVELVTVEKGTHSWPGGYFYGSHHEPELETATGVSAADLLWAFFAAHPRRAGSR